MDSLSTIWKLVVEREFANHLICRVLISWHNDFNTAGTAYYEVFYD